jgi:hypothetical protein
MLSMSIAAHFFQLIDTIHVIDGPAIGVIAMILLSAWLTPESHPLHLIHAVLRFGAVAFLFADPGRRWFKRPAELSPPAQKVLS